MGELDIFKIRTISWLFNDTWKWFINSDSEDDFNKYKGCLKDLPKSITEGFEYITQEMLHIDKGVVTFDCAISHEDEDTIVVDVKVVSPDKVVQKYMHFEKE